MHNKRKIFGWFAAGVVAALSPAMASAQAGAVGAAVAVGGGVENAHSSAPIQSEHALTLGTGRTAFTVHAGLTSGSVGSNASFEVIQTLIGGFYGVSDDLTIGAILFPVTNISLDVTDPTSGASFSESGSGVGDLSLYGKYALGESADGRTSFAAIASLELPTAGTADLGGTPISLGLDGVAIGIGGAVSHRASSSSFHGSAQLAIPTSDLDGDAFVRLGGAAVFGVSDRVGLSGEVLANVGSETQFTGGPGVRFQASDNVFLDVAALFLLGSSISEDPFDYGLVVGLNIGG